MIKLLLIKPIVMSYNGICSYLLFINFTFKRVRTRGNIGNKKNLFLKLETKLGLFHVLLTTQKSSPEKLTLTVVEMQQLLNFDEIDSMKGSFLPKMDNILWQTKNLCKIQD